MHEHGREQPPPLRAECKWAPIASPAQEVVIAQWFRREANEREYHQIRHNDRLDRAEMVDIFGTGHGFGSHRQWNTHSYDTAELFHVSAKIHRTLCRLCASESSTFPFCGRPRRERPALQLVLQVRVTSCTRYAVRFSSVVEFPRF